MERWKEVCSEHFDHHPDSLFAWKGCQRSLFKQAGAGVRFRKPFPFSPSILTSYNTVHVYIMDSVFVSLVFFLASVWLSFKQK